MTKVSLFAQRQAFRKCRKNVFIGPRGKVRQSRLFIVQVGHTGENAYHGTFCI